MISVESHRPQTVRLLLLTTMNTLKVVGAGEVNVGQDVSLCVTKVSKRLPTFTLSDVCEQVNPIRSCGS